jgi:hypothetical protein
MNVTSMNIFSKILDKSRSGKKYKQLNLPLTFNIESFFTIHLTKYVRVLLQRKLYRTNIEKTNIEKTSIDEHLIQYKNTNVGRIETPKNFFVKLSAFVGIKIYA